MHPSSNRTRCLTLLALLLLVVPATLLVALPGTMSGRRCGKGASAAVDTSTTPPKADAFQSIIGPLLATKCAPCHNPGGKQYAKLPFDDPNVVASHKEGVLKRLKGDDRKVVEAWMGEAERSRDREEKLRFRRES